MVLRGAKESTSDHSTAGAAGRTSQVILHILLRLDILAELHHHYVGNRVSVLIGRMSGGSRRVFGCYGTVTFSVPQSGKPLTPGILSV